MSTYTNANGRTGPDIDTLLEKADTAVQPEDITDVVRQGDILENLSVGSGVAENRVLTSDGVEGFNWTAWPAFVAPGDQLSTLSVGDQIGADLVLTSDGAESFDWKLPVDQVARDAAGAAAQPGDNLATFTTGDGVGPNQVPTSDGAGGFTWQPIPVPDDDPRLAKADNSLQPNDRVTSLRSPSSAPIGATIVADGSGGITWVDTGGNPIGDP